MEKNPIELSVGEIVSNGLSIGMKNFVNLVIAAILWGVTAWIPYLNLGTTIGALDIIARIGRGDKFSPTDIFDAKYRARIGEFFLFLAFYFAGLLASYPFFASPIVQTAWSMGPFLFVDKDADPLEALKKSNRLTYGHKLTIFLSMIAVMAVVLLIAMIGAVANSTIIMILAFLVSILTVPVYAGAVSYIYNKLTGDAVAA